MIITAIIIPTIGDIIINAVNPYIIKEYMIEAFVNVISYTFSLSFSSTTTNLIISFSFNDLSSVVSFSFKYIISFAFSSLNSYE